ncbi:MAG: outer membrane beta-barrel protein [Williamsia sp.]|nr:outer membrane beta-barrel protein [Williamsia sp.]
MKKHLVFVFFLAAVLCSTYTEAQYYIRPPMDRRYHDRRSPEYSREDLGAFKPSLNISVGYGFPNLDKSYLPAFYQAYIGSASQQGPLTAAVDYQFSRYMSIGLLATHGTVSAPYYDYNSTGSAAFTGKLTNWSFLVDLVRYMPVNSQVVSPYIRTAIGLNTWSQQYTDVTGAKIDGVSANNLPGLAYQAGIGAKFNLSKRAGLFAEAGYGKFILHGGMSFRF